MGLILFPVTSEQIQNNSSVTLRCHFGHKVQALDHYNKRQAFRQATVQMTVTINMIPACTSPNPNQKQHVQWASSFSVVSIFSVS